jgi:hypothetical protein
MPCSKNRTQTVCGPKTTIAGGLLVRSTHLLPSVGLCLLASTRAQTRPFLLENRVTEEEATKVDKSSTSQPTQQHLPSLITRKHTQKRTADGCSRGNWTAISKLDAAAGSPPVPVPCVSTAGQHRQQQHDPSIKIRGPNLTGSSARSPPSVPLSRSETDRDGSFFSSHRANPMFTFRHSFLVCPKQSASRAQVDNRS